MLEILKKSLKILNQETNCVCVCVYCEAYPHLPYLSFSSVAQPCLTLCNPMNCSTPGFPIHHQLLELAQTHVHQVGEAIQPSYILPYPTSFPVSRATIYCSQNDWCSD